MLGNQRESWLAARLEDLDYGDIDGICAAARAYPLVGNKKDDLDKALAYFENNAPRMRYKWFRSRGLFTGSGVAEAGCKAIVAQRLKLSGMRWTVAGADAIIALRCREASSQWDLAAAPQPDSPPPDPALTGHATPAAASYPSVTYKIGAHPHERGAGRSVGPSR